MESVRRMVGGKMSPVIQVNSQVPAYLSDAIDRAMKIEPEDRFQSAAEFKAALAAAATAVFARPAIEYPVQPPTPERYSPPRPEAAPAIQAPSQQTAPGKQAQPIVQAQPVGGKEQPALQTPSPVQARPFIQAPAGVSPPPARQVPPVQQAIPGIQAARPARPYQPMVPEEPAAVTSRPNRRLITGLGMVGIGLLCGLALLAAVLWYRGELGNTPTATLLPTATSASISAGGVIFGPASGSLVHNPANADIEAILANVDVQDFTIGARFYNPYGANEHQWDYGFIFRHQGANNQFRLLVFSDGTWALLNNRGEPDWTVIHKGNARGLNTNSGQSNVLRVVCDGARGTFSINGQAVAELDLSSRMNSGAIFIITGHYQDDEVAGKATSYDDFIVWSLP
jgi:hypothetical protein